jgi:antitoxin component YwqK of YwqJK toxin-antitoxin module
MKRLVFIILLFIYSIKIFSQNFLNETYKGMSDGKYETFYKNGTKVLFTISNGNLENEHISFFKNGQVQRIDSLKNGRFNGVCKEYNRKGLLRFEDVYRNDTILISSEYQYYRFSKRIKASQQIEFIIDSSYKNPVSVINGSTSSKIKSELLLKTVNSIGKNIFYYRTGQISMVENLKNDLREGSCYSLFKNGNTYQEYLCKDGLTAGECKIYNSSGKLIAIEIWENGKRIGVQKIKK